MMSKKLLIVLIILTNLMAIPSLFLYAFYESWVGVIGFGIGLISMGIISRIRRKEFKGKHGKINKKAERVFKIILSVLTVANFMFAVYKLYIGDIKSAIFLLEICIFMVVVVCVMGREVRESRIKEIEPDL